MLASKPMLSFSDRKIAVIGLFPHECKHGHRLPCVPQVGSNLFYGVLALYRSFCKKSLLQKDMIE
jgi:hypothetical protein